MFLFSKIAKRFKSARTLGALCEAAEKHALAESQKQPGAEHLLQAAFDLPDGTARRVFERLGKSPGDVRKAIVQQYKDALQGIGIEGDVSTALLDPPAGPAQRTRLYRAQPSGQAVIEALAELKKNDGDLPLLGAHILLAVARLRHGVVARTLRTMDIDADRLAREAQAEIQRHIHPA